MIIKRRTVYAVLFGLLLATEIYIALFVRDSFVRPYVGDMLVTLLIGAFCRIFFPERPRLLAVYVFLFAALVEVGQYFDFVALLGLADNRFFSILLGRSFSWLDLLCYAVGCLALFGLERVLPSICRSEGKTC